MEYLDVSIGVINTRKISETRKARKFTVESAADTTSVPRNLGASYDLVSSWSLWGPVKGRAVRAASKALDPCMMPEGITLVWHTLHHSEPLISVIQYNTHLWSPCHIKSSDLDMDDTNVIITASWHGWCPAQISRTRLLWILAALSSQLPSSPENCPLPSGSCLAVEKRICLPLPLEGLLLVSDWLTGRAWVGWGRGGGTQRAGSFQDAVYAPKQTVRSGWS